MNNNKISDTMWDDNPIDITQEANFIWSIANKLRGSYMPDHYGDVIIPMTILRRFECALEEKKRKVVDAFKADSTLPYKKLCKISGFQFYNTSEYTLAELCNDSKRIAVNFKNYLDAFRRMYTKFSTIWKCSSTLTRWTRTAAFIRWSRRLPRSIYPLRHTTA